MCFNISLFCVNVTMWNITIVCIVFLLRFDADLYSLSEELHWYFFPLCCDWICLVRSHCNVALYPQIVHGYSWIHGHPHKQTWVTIFNYSASKVNGIFVSRGKITGRIRKNLLVFSNFSTFLPLFPHFCQNFAYFSTCTLKILSWKV